MPWTFPPHWLSTDTELLWPGLRRTDYLLKGFGKQRQRVSPFHNHNFSRAFSGDSKRQEIKIYYIVFPRPVSYPITIWSLVNWDRHKSQSLLWYDISVCLRLISELKWVWRQWYLRGRETKAQRKWLVMNVLTHVIEPQQTTKMDKLTKHLSASPSDTIHGRRPGQGPSFKVTTSCLMAKDVISASILPPSETWSTHPLTDFGKINFPKPQFSPSGKWK